MAPSHAHKSQSHPAHLLAPWILYGGIALAGGLGLTFLSWRIATAAEAKTRQTMFDSRTQDIRRRIEQRLEAYGQVLRGLGGHVRASGASREGFHRYVASLDLDGAFKGIVALGYQQRIPATAAENLTVAMRREGETGFTVRPLGARPWMAPVTRIEPETPRNLQVLGFDPLSDPARRQAMEEAAAHGDLALSPRVTLAQDSPAGGEAGVLLYLPVRRQTVSGRDPDGWVFGAFRLQDLIAGIGGTWNTETDIEIFDGDGQTPAARLYPPVPGAAPRTEGLRSTARLTFGHRNWTIVFRARDTFGHSGGDGTSWTLLWGGLAATLFLMGLVLVQVTRRARAETAAREGESTYRAALEAMDEGFILFDPEGRAVFANAQADRILGLRPSQLGPWLQPPAEWQVLGEDGEAFPAKEHPVRAVIEAGAPLGRATLGLRRPGGTVRWLHVNAVPLKTGAVAAAATLTDITETRETQQALEASQRHFSRVFHLSPDGILINRLSDGAYLDCNEGFSIIMGWTWEELKGRTTLDPGRAIWVRPEDRNRMVDALKATGEFRGLDLEFRRKDGVIIQAQMSARIIEVDGTPCVLSVSRDVSAQVEEGRERRRLEAEVNHLQRLEAIGRLVSGLSHDMNNVLGAILSLASVQQEKYGADPDLRRMADLIVQASDRGRNLVKSLRDFSRRELVGEAEVDLNTLVRTEAELLERTTLKKVEVRLDLQEGLPSVKGEASAISTALMNLCVNACDAMPEGGRITLSTRDAGAGLLQVMVEDTGEGMPPEVLAKAREPFFTTKAQGKGTGLGLSQVFGTMKAHGGTFEILSEPGRGTQVILGFPATEGSGAPPPRPAEAPALARGRRILLVDDDPGMRMATQIMLEQKGHHVFTAANGEEGVRSAEGALDLDVALVDLSMPGMDGGQVIERLSTLRPGLRVVLCTGFVDDRVPRILARHPGVGILTKPFTLGELETALA